MAHVRMYISFLVVHCRCEFLHNFSFQVYDPPVPEFAVASVKVSGKLALPKVSGPSIVIVMDGDVTITTAGDGKSLTVKKGSVIFLPVTAEVIFQPINPGQTCHLFQAYCSL